MKTPIQIRFGQAVRKRRERLKMSQEAFAYYVGVHRTYMGKVERGNVAISIVKAEQIAEALGVPLSRLIKNAEKPLS